MERIFSPAFKFGSWRRLWLALAEEQKALGLPIDDAQIAAIRAHLDDTDVERAAEIEREVRHDVMAQVRTLAEQAPEAAPILHLGATSADIADNAEIIQIREAMRLLRRRLLSVVARLRDFADREKGTACLGWTHFQAAQPTTIGKRACLWIFDLLTDLAALDERLVSIRFRGIKGTTGTQASFLALFEGDASKVEALDAGVAARLGFDRTYPVTGQTYPRKLDAQVLAVLSGIGQSLSKLGNDLRLLQHLREVEEPFGSAQIGSSAMAYKRNPMRAERLCALGRHLIALESGPAMTAATQWLERTLDDSAGRRLQIAEAFLTADAALLVADNVTNGLVVRRRIVARRLAAEIPFMATENILMAAVRKGGNRQELHERIRVVARETADRIAEEGGENDLLDRIAADPAFELDAAEVAALVRPEEFIGLAPRQVERFLHDEVDPALAGYSAENAADLRV
jgi:adenylosuccinate lyase